MNLIIRASLAEPPSESLYFRYLTLVAQKNLNYFVLIESEKEMKDLYFNYFRNKGLMDYVDQIIVPEEKENGVRLDIINNRPETIVVKKIDCENVINLIGQISFRR
jgi:hypothetical protein